MTDGQVEAWEYYAKQAGITPPTDEERQVIRQKRDEHVLIVAQCDKEIQQLKEQISKLQDMKEQTIPGVKGARHVHDRSFNQYNWRTTPCFTRSIIYSGSTPQGGASGGDDTYYCLFCQAYL